MKGWSLEMNDILAIKKAITHLSENELRSYLGFILLRIEDLRKKEIPLEESVAELIEIYDNLMGLQSRRIFWDPDPSCTHVHIVHSDSFAGSMKQILRGIDPTQDHKLIILRENYAIGPLGDLDTPEGREARSIWFCDHITDGYEADAEFDEEFKALQDRLEQIPDQAQVIIWTIGNVCEQAGLRHAIYLLRNKPNSIVVCDAGATAEKMFNRPDASYRHSGEIPPDKLREVFHCPDSCVALSTADIEQLQQEWKIITEQTGTLRIWQDNTVLEAPADYYDQYLLDTLDKLRPAASNNDFLKSARLIGEALGYCEQCIGDSYFEYRLREMIYSGILEIQGVPAGMRFYSIRRKSR